MNDLLHRMEMWRQGMGVRRFHTWPTVGEQTVGHHSCGVALVVVLCHPDPSSALLTAALVHDLSEGVLGDVPATTKWRSPLLQEEWHKLERQVDGAMGLLPTHPLSDEDSYCLLAADAMEGLLWCREQEALGNKNYRTVAINWLHYLDEFFDKHAGHVPIKFAQLYTDLWNYFSHDTRMEVVE